MNVSFIPERPVHHRSQALPSARILAKQLDIDIDSLNTDRYLKKEHIHKHLTEEPEGKCKHISMSLDCMIGGFGNLQCMNTHYHKKCKYKTRVRQILEDREKINKMF
ncbi:hypothetical protein ACFLQN_04305 [Candidatus Aenigmatarchaeota archaeon]